MLVIRMLLKIEMKDWKELGLKESNMFHIMSYLLYKKGILSEDEVVIIANEMSGYNTFEHAMNVIENDFDVSK